MNTRGFVAPGFEGVAEEFERNFAERDELGAAFAAVRDGETVIDVHGGLADRAAGRPWSDDTLQLIFSGT
jgi:CubicO group peptidase (beta-lactamase class C family)